MPTLEDFQVMVAKAREARVQQSTLYRKAQEAEAMQQQQQQEQQEQMSEFFQRVFDGAKRIQRIRQYEQGFRNAFRQQAMRERQRQQQDMSLMPLIRAYAAGGGLVNSFAGGGDAMYVEMPDYKVDTGSGNTKLPLGHGMVIAVDEETGKTRGSEYGRYDAENKGIARRVTVPDLVVANPGNPTDEELNKYAEQLYNAYGHAGGKVRVHYVKGADEDNMIKLMESAESGDRKNGYYIDHDYRIVDHNCGTYGATMIKKSMPWYKLSGFGLYTLGTPGGIHPYWGGTGEYSE